MAITLTEDQISKCLQDAIKDDPSSDGFSEIELTEETRLKCAAVLIPLVWYDDEWHLLFTRRTDTVESHKGQVSFPGGACDEGETTPEQTALREADEEIGIHPGNVRVLGRLSNLILTSFAQSISMRVLRIFIHEPISLKIYRLFAKTNHSITDIHPFDTQSSSISKANQSPANQWRGFQNSLVIINCTQPIRWHNLNNIPVSNHNVILLRFGQSYSPCISNSASVQNSCR